MIVIIEGKRVVIHRLVQHVVRLSFREDGQIYTLNAAIEGEFGKWNLNDLSLECMSHRLHLSNFIHCNPTYCWPHCDQSGGWHLHLPSDYI